MYVVFGIKGSINNEFKWKSNKVLNFPHELQMYFFFQFVKN